MPEKKEQHDVEYDTVGFTHMQRFTCVSPGCDGATLVIQPWMREKGQEFCQQKADEFMEKHPCKKVRNLGWRG